MNDNVKLVEELADKIKTGDVQPWKAESVLMEEYNVSAPEHFRTAALSRRMGVRANSATRKRRSASLAQRREKASTAAT